MSEYPNDLHYTSDHEWVAAQGEGIYRVGITWYAQDALGDVVYVNLPSVGDTVTAGESCGEIESTKSVSDIFAPISGEVVAVNEELDSAPEQTNTDPYTSGWMFDIKADDESTVEGMMDAAAYEASLA